MTTEVLDEAMTPIQEKVKAIYLTVDDLKIAASILYNAYVDDPLFVDIFQAEKEANWENILKPFLLLHYRQFFESVA